MGSKHGEAVIHLELEHAQLHDIGLDAALRSAVQRYEDDEQNKDRVQSDLSCCDRWSIKSRCLQFE